MSLPDGLAERARSAVRQGRVPSVRAYVASAQAEKVKLDDLSALLDEMLADTGDAGALIAFERNDRGIVALLLRNLQHHHRLAVLLA